MAKRWVFLDVGNVLLDEDPLTYLAFLRHAEAAIRVRPGLTLDDLLSAREACAAAGSRWPVYEAVAPILGDLGCVHVWESTSREVRARFAELSPPIPGAAGLMDRLSRRYRLGLIANQGPECRDWLDALGWLGRFEVVAFSEELGAAKPDPLLFRHATQLAQAASGDCLMVGDRLDNDIAPAAALGMHTAWVRWPSRRDKGWAPAAPNARAYLDSLERLAQGANAAAPQPRPTFSVDGLGALADAILAHFPG